MTERRNPVWRTALAYALYALGHVISRLPRFPYRIYNRLMLASEAIQGTGPGPWQ